MTSLIAPEVNITSCDHVTMTSCDPTVMTSSNASAPRDIWEPDVIQRVGTVIYKQNYVYSIYLCLLHA